MTDITEEMIRAGYKALRESILIEVPIEDAGKEIVGDIYKAMKAKEPLRVAAYVETDEYIKFDWGDPCPKRISFNFSKGKSR